MKTVIVAASFLVLALALAANAKDEEKKPPVPDTNPVAVITTSLGTAVSFSHTDMSTPP